MPLASGSRVRIEQETDYPVGDTIRIAVKPEKSEQFTLQLRIPAWSAKTSLAINGQAQPAPAPGKYAALKRTWQAGDTVTLKLDLRARRILAPGDPTHAAVVRGPIVLARDRRLESNVDAPAEIAADAAGYVAVTADRGERPANVWMVFRVPVKGVGDLRMCDFSSAGNTWSEASQYRVWTASNVAR